jgi:adenylate cyclase
MKEAEIAEVGRWLAGAGLAGSSETALVDGFCQRLVACGVPLARCVVFIDTLHPVYEGRSFRWEREQPQVILSAYGRTTAGEFAERWRSSPFYRLLETGQSWLRRRLSAEVETEFPLFAELRAAAITDYLAIINRFGSEAVIGEMDCFYSSWMSDGADGFNEGHIAALHGLMPLLGLAIKSASLSRIAETLVETYLGRDAGRRVLRGGIARGVADRIEAVLWFSDLQHYTHIADSSPPEQIIPLLNDYADAVVSSIHHNNGDVLKFMGDGVLAIFPAAERHTACSAALTAANAVQKAVQALNVRRADQRLPTTKLYLGLHIGTVFYGNIGIKERLDFTVVGPAVNEVSRIASMCRSVEQPILISEEFAEAALAERHRFVSVGRYALRGVARPQALYTLDRSL